MRYMFLILMTALLVKDVLPLGDRFVLRGASEGLALAAGAGWLATHPARRCGSRFVIVFFYLAALAATAAFSARPLFVLLQVVSLSSVILFFMAYVESSPMDKEETFRWTLTAVTLAFVLICSASLGLLAVRPSLVFEVTTEGNRFRGAFNEPAMMGAVAGLLFGLAIFGRTNGLFSLMGVLASAPCLYLTGSRTSWAAVAGALLITASVYLKRRGRWLVAGALIGIIAILGSVLVDWHISAKTQSRVIRSDSLGTLSGRTLLWELALEKYRRSPFLGYGFTTGSDALAADMGPTLSAAFGVAGRANQKSFSLHSGYIQSLLDSGAIGLALYLGVIGTALWRVYRHDDARRYGAVMYGLIFFMLSNVADTIIFGAAVFYEVLYWYLAVLALATETRGAAAPVPAYASFHPPRGEVCA